MIAQTHNISVSGSNGKISHYLSGRLYDYNGLFNFTPDTYRTMNLRSKVSSQVFKWLKISNNFDYTHDRYRQPMGYSKEGGGVLWRSLNDQGHPSSPIFNPDGTLTKSGAYAIGGLVTGNNWLDRTTKTLKNTTTLNVTMLENRLRLTGDFSFRTKDYTETKKTTRNYGPAGNRDSRAVRQRPLQSLPHHDGKIPQLQLQQHLADRHAGRAAGGRLQQVERHVPPHREERRKRHQNPCPCAV